MWGEGCCLGGVQSFSLWEVHAFVGLVGPQIPALAMFVGPHMPDFGGDDRFFCCGGGGGVTFVGLVGPQIPHFGGLGEGAQAELCSRGGGGGVYHQSKNWCPVHPYCCKLTQWTFTEAQ